MDKYLFKVNNKDAIMFQCFFFFTLSRYLFSELQLSNIKTIIQSLQKPARVNNREVSAIPMDVVLLPPSLIENLFTTLEIFFIFLQILPITLLLFLLNSKKNYLLGHLTCWQNELYPIVICDVFRAQSNINDAD